MTRVLVDDRPLRRRSPARAAALTALALALCSAPRGPPGCRPALGADGASEADATAVDVGPVAYRLVALEPLLAAVDARGTSDAEDVTVDLRGDGTWRSAGVVSDARSLAAARALLDELAAADGSRASAASRARQPASPRGPERVEERWSLVATWEASALVATDDADDPRPGFKDAGPPAAGWVVARARRCVATALPPPRTGGGSSWEADDLLRAGPPHPDPPLSSRRATPTSRTPWRRAREPTAPAAGASAFDDAIGAARRGDLDQARRLLDALMPREPPGCESLAVRGIGRDAAGTGPGSQRSPSAPRSDGTSGRAALRLDWHAEVALATGDAAIAAARLSRLATCLGGGRTAVASIDGPSMALVSAYFGERAAIASWRAGDATHRREAVALAAKARARLEAVDPPSARSLAVWERLARANALDARGDPRLGDRLASRAIEAAASAQAPMSASQPSSADASPSAEGDAVAAAFALAAGDERRAAALLRRALDETVDARGSGSRPRAPSSPVEDARRRTVAWLEARTR